MIHIYFLGIEAFVILGYVLGNALFPKHYSLIFYKFFGISVFSLLVWYLALFTEAGWTGLLPLAFGILIFASVIVSILFKHRLRLPSKRELFVFIGIELLTYVIYLFLVYIRTYKTDIFGTEKLMDVALINAIMKQNHLPIENPWLSGFFMNYYYFGHFILGMFQYIFQIPTAVGYNLAISLFGIWIVQAGYLVAKKLRLGDLKAFFVSALMTFGGNLYLLIQTITHTSANQWFASATRVIPFTINEFPSYSIVLGDLHGHFLSYPFYLVGIFLLLDIFFPIEEEKRDEWIIPKSLFLGVLLGHLYLTNSWDILTLAILGAMIVALISWYMRMKEAKTWASIRQWYMRVALFVGLPVIALSVPQFLSSRSYYLPPVGGIGLNTVFSGPGEMFMLFGQFVIIVALASGILWFAYKKFGKLVFEKLVYSQKIALPIILLLVGVVIIMLVEFVYAKDVFTVLNPPYARTNTVFKIYFHAWSLLALGSVSLFLSSFSDIFARLKKVNALLVFYTVFFGVVAVMLSYPVTSIDQYIAPKLTELTTRRIADPRWSNGYSFMKDVHGADYELVSYLLTKPYAKILEIVSYDSYSYYARISSFTGMSTVTGWPLHNVQWYNGYDGKGKRIDTGELELMKVADRVVDVEKMYTSENTDVVRDLLHKYRVQYVVFGDQEYVWAEDKEKKLNENVYKSLCRIDWEQDGTTLYDCTEK